MLLPHFRTANILLAAVAAVRLMYNYRTFLGECGATSNASVGGGLMVMNQVEPGLIMTTTTATAEAEAVTLSRTPAPLLRQQQPREDVSTVTASTTAVAPTKLPLPPPQEGERKAVKVFGLGLSKTATTSFAAAMEQFGYKTLHTDRTLAQYMHHADERPNLSGFYDHVDSVWDIPTAAYYKELLAAYPTAKFVLVTRNATEWYQSFQHYHNDFHYYRWGCAFPERVNRLHKFVYGSAATEPTSYISSMERHNREVVEYFEEKGIQDQLLVIHMEKGNAHTYYPQICDFVGLSHGPCENHHATTKVYPDFPSSNSKGGNAKVLEEEEKCPPGLGSKEATKPPSKHAYVMHLCNPTQKSQFGFLQLVLVQAENLRQYDKESDIIVILYGDMRHRHKKLMAKYDIQIIQVKAFGGPYKIADPNGEMTPSQSQCYAAKMWALLLTQYEKVMYVDGDMWFNYSPTYLFDELTPDKDAIMFHGAISPVNAGIFIFRPSNQAYVDVLDILTSGAFTPANGWLNYGPFEEWPGKLPKRSPDDTAVHYSNWTFHGAHIDQGLLFYYFDRLLGRADLRDKVNPLFNHFTGKNKPYLKDANRLDDETYADLLPRYKEATKQWYDMRQAVTSKLTGTSHKGIWMDIIDKTVDNSHQLNSLRDKSSSSKKKK